MWYDEKVSQYQLSEGADETTFKRSRNKTIKIYKQTSERRLPINRGRKPRARSIKTFKKGRIELFSIPLQNIFQCCELR